MSSTRIMRWVDSAAQCLPTESFVIWEWVADWVPRSTSCPGWAGFSDDSMCLAGASETLGPGALLRGGSVFFFFGGGSNAGVFAVDGFFRPSLARFDIGFRCAR